MIEFLLNYIWFKNRKGNKPIYAVAILALSMMVVAAYFAAFSGALDSVVTGLNEGVKNLK